VLTLLFGRSENNEIKGNLHRGNSGPKKIFLVSPGKIAWPALEVVYVSKLSLHGNFLIGTC